MSNCPYCHAPVTANESFCNKCGYELKQAVAVPARSGSSVSQQASVAAAPADGVCSACGAPLTVGELFCNTCGASAAQTGQALAVSPAPLQSTCPRCGHVNTKPGKFCNSCGYHYTATVGSGLVSSPADASVPAERLAVGTMLVGRYKIERQIGEGGMGAVYLVQDTLLMRKVVIKALLSEDDPEAVAQSVQERRFLAEIKHANIVSIYDFIATGTHGYIVMEHVNGKTLDDIITEQGHPLPVADAIRAMLGILPAFVYLAKAGYVYNDFKPQNVMIEELRDGTQIYKLIDLGTLGRYDPKVRPRAVYGTPGFHAPDVTKKTCVPSPETDLYTIVRTLAYLVTGMDVVDPRWRFGMPPAGQFTVLQENPALYRLCVRGTHKLAEHRFHSAQELIEQLEGVQRLTVGGLPGMPISSRMFASGVAATGKLGVHGETTLDETDRAINILRYGDQAFHGGKYAEAAASYKRASITNGKSLDAHLRLAEVLIDAGVVAGNEGVTSQVSATLLAVAGNQSLVERVTPENAGQLLFSLAQAEISAAAGLAPDSWKIAWYHGRLLEAQGDLPAAADRYRLLIDDAPGELQPLLALARVRALEGDDDEAVVLYSAVLKADPGNTEAIFGVTNSYYNRHRWADAMRVLAGVSEEAAKYIDAQFLLADLYLNQLRPLTFDNVERAAQVMHALLGRTEDPRYYRLRGNVYMAAWELARAGQIPDGATLEGLADTRAKTLGAAAEESFAQYLRSARNPQDREQVVRDKCRVSPWRFW